MVSVVPGPDMEPKLHLLNIYTISNDFFDDSLNNFLHLICKLQATVVLYLLLNRLIM